METNSRNDINLTELLIQISKDVASIKTDMSNFKEAQKVEKENTTKELLELRDDFQKGLSDLESKTFSKIGKMQAVQDSIVEDISNLKHQEDKKDAKKWRTVVAYVATAILGMVIGKLPDIFITLVNSGGK